MGLGVIRIINDRGVSLGDRLRPLLFQKQYSRFRQMRGRIVRRCDDGALGPILGALEVALRIVAMERKHPKEQGSREADHRGDKFGINGERALEEPDCGLIA
jgi:hypothetical protein